jgi:thymidylate synthase (FAD)
MSARYRQLEPEFFYPDKVRIADPRNKQGSIEVDSGLAALWANYQNAYDAAWDSYEQMLQHGVARELARSVLPVGIYSEMLVTGNLLNWMRFVKLRRSMDAQQEIREYANGVAEILAERVPLSQAALAANL